MDSLYAASLYEPVEYPKNSGNYVIYITKEMFLQCISLKNDIDIQRELDMDWVASLKEKALGMHTINNYYDFGLFHVGELHGRVYILDGQHRYMVLRDLPDANIDVQVKLYHFKDKHELHTRFQMINGGKAFQSFESISDQIIINGFRKHMMKKYKPYLSSANNPRAPNINLNKLVDKMSELNFISSMGFKTSEDLIQCVENLNDVYRYTTTDTFVNQWHVKDAEKRIIACKSKSNRPLLFGLYSHFEWLDVIIRCHQQKLDYHAVPHYPMNYREPIGQPLRRAVWRKRNKGFIDGNCFCCSRRIYIQDFDCGHITSVFYGGTTDVNNLEPICRMCNRDMGTNHLVTFKNIYYGNQ